MSSKVRPRKRPKPDRVGDPCDAGGIDIDLFAVVPAARHLVETARDSGCVAGMQSHERIDPPFDSVDRMHTACRKLATTLNPAGAPMEVGDRITKLEECMVAEGGSREQNRLVLRDFRWLIDSFNHLLKSLGWDVVWTGQYQRIVFGGRPVQEQLPEGWVYIEATDRTHPPEMEVATINAIERAAQKIENYILAADEAKTETSGTDTSALMGVPPLSSKEADPMRISYAGGIKPGELRIEVEISVETVRTAAIEAEVTRPKRGKGNFLYTGQAVHAIAERRKSLGAKEDEIGRWNSLLNRMGMPKIGFKPKAKSKLNPNR